jgi:hypothetical protein
VTVEIWISGFLFLIIIVIYLVILRALGYKVEIDNIDAELERIIKSKTKFQISLGIALMHNFLVITLAIMVFIAFNTYNIMLGIVWVIFRIGEGLILSYNDKNYWGLLKVAKKYSITSGNEKITLYDLTRTLSKRKSFLFSFAMIFWAIGTFSFSIMLLLNEIVPLFISLLGIAGSISVGFSHGLVITKHRKVLFDSISGIVALVFEISIGLWMLIFL